MMMMNSDNNIIRDTCNHDDDNVHEVKQDYDDDNIDDAMDCDEVTVNEATWNYDEDNVDFAAVCEEAELASAMIDILHFSLLLRSHLCHICISISLQQEHVILIFSFDFLNFFNPPPLMCLEATCAIFAFQQEHL